MQFSDSLSAIEYMDWDSAQFALNYLKQDNPFPNQRYEFYMLMEVTSGDCENAAEDL